MSDTTEAIEGAIAALKQNQQATAPAIRIPGIGPGVRAGGKKQRSVYARVAQPTSGNIPDDCKIGDFYTTEGDILGKSFEAILLNVHYARSYTLNREYMCSAPNGDVGKAPQPIHPQESYYNSCNACSFSDKPESSDGSYTKAPCQVSVRVQLWLTKIDKLVTLDLKGSSYQEGSSLISSITQRWVDFMQEEGGGANPPQLYEFVHTFSAEKAKGKPFYRISVEDNPPANEHNLGELKELFELLDEQTVSTTESMKTRYEEEKVQKSSSKEEGSPLAQDGNDIPF